MRTLLAPLLQGFFTERLMHQMDASPLTAQTYRDAFRLLLDFAQRELGKAPSSLLLTDLDAPFIAKFLGYLEKDRGNSARTRNARLAALRSFFRYVAPKEPAHSDLVRRVLAIPQKRCDRNLVAFLPPEEVRALLAAPDRTTWIGRRDHALLAFAIETGLRVSELVGLTIDQLSLGRGAHVRCRGKGRKERATPLTRTTSRLLLAWLHENDSESETRVFPSRRGGPLSRDAVERLVALYAARAGKNCATLRGKRVSPHVLRHTTAVQLLRAGVDRSVIALWLGHESIETTQMYLDADLAIKEAALEKTPPLPTRHGRYKPADSLLAFLATL
jgi:integrase/recombinase XerD